MHAMRNWDTPLSDLGTIPLTSDPRLSHQAEDDDQVWAVTTRNIQPPALHLYTRLGGEARPFQIFPMFTKDKSIAYKVEDFPSGPRIHKLAPNFLSLSFSPLSGVRCQAEYWIPSSQSAAGKFILTNQSRSFKHFTFHLAAVLNPSSQGRHMHTTTWEGRQVLSGETGTFHPLVFLTGSSSGETGPFTNLSQEIALDRGESVTLQWISATMHAGEASFRRIETLLHIDWQTVFARIENAGQAQLDIHTGNQAWDLAFALTQNIALGSFAPHDHTQTLYPPRDRRMDPDHLPAPDGARDARRKLPHITPLQSLYLADNIRLAAPDLVPSLVDQFTALGDKDGFIPFRNHPPEDSSMLASPYLAQLTWKIYQTTQDLKMLERSYPALIGYLERWFSTAQDRDQDGSPEWSRPRQTECSTHPTQPSSESWFHSPAIQYMESPALCALLVKEIETLTDIAREIQDETRVQPLSSRLDGLRRAINKSWNASLGRYQRWDRDSHQSPQGELLMESTGAGLMIIKKKLDIPSRILIHLHSPQPLPPKTRIFLHGEGPDGEHWVEKFSGPQIHWVQDHGRATSKNLFTFVEYVVPSGIGPEVELSLHTANMRSDDLMMYLPLRAQLPPQERARIMVHQKQSPGFSLGADSDPRSSSTLEQPVSIVWHTLLLEGFIAYGYREHAADQFQRLMRLITSKLANHRSFFAEYDAETGAGIGVPYTIFGLAPLGLFLRILGVEMQDNREVRLEGSNPFPWDITLRYRGLEVQRGMKKTTVTFPNGHSATVENQGRKMIQLRS